MTIIPTPLRSEIPFTPDVELPIDSEEADQENKSNGKTLLFVLGRGYVLDI